MKYIADLHIHSKYSIATSKMADLEHLYLAAKQKGITVLGTGDATHPQWYAEISQKLEPAEPGLFKLRDEFRNPLLKRLSSSCQARPMRFMISMEISNIYKKVGKTRKNHNLVYFPDLDACHEFNRKLERIGNIHSDGRPILGLDARDLLELVLETSDDACLVPAHIWTPWFSVLGSKSGFDRIEQCFEDLSDHVFALETGLSSDPSMNWRVSDLDRFVLISNSDAHSPAKLGREANLFSTELSYFALWEALRSQSRKNFLGTLEFFPQEGKYHADGHRACNLRLDPSQTLALNGICPVCSKPLTRGVLYRVNELADRPPRNEIKRFPFQHMIPLTEVLGQVLQVGPNAKRVQSAYSEVVDKLGPELEILIDLDLQEIERAGIPLLGEALRRVRAGDLEVSAGYDGQYGTIHIFGPEEHQKLMGQKPLFELPAIAAPVEKPVTVPRVARPSKEARAGEKQGGHPHQQQMFRENLLEGLNSAQYQAVGHRCGPLLVTAGPGTGKTRVLTHRIAYLVRTHRVDPRAILAITFTRKAAQEMQHRLQQLLDTPSLLPYCATIHAFCLDLLKIRDQGRLPYLLDTHQRRSLIKDIRLLMGSGAPPLTIVDPFISQAKRQLLDPNDDLREISGSLDADQFSQAVAFYRHYQRVLRAQDCYDFEDLIFESIRFLQTDADQRQRIQHRFEYLSIDEYQDLDYGQYQLIRLLAPRASANICAIGDPDQAIYGFRGSDVEYFKRFLTDYPGASVVHLRQNYRSTQTILDAAYQVLQTSSSPKIQAQKPDTRRLTLVTAPSEKSEAFRIAKTIESLMAGWGFAFEDFGLATAREETEPLAFSDFAVLYRTTRQRRILSQTFDKIGIPYQSVSHQALIERLPVKRLMSLARILTAAGTYADLEEMIALLGPTIGRDTFQIFKTWAYEKELSPEEAIQNAQRFRLPGLSTGRQQRLYRFLVEIIRLRNQMAPVKKVAEQLRFALRVSKIGLQWDKSQRDQDGFDQIMRLADESQDMEQFLTSLAIASDTDVYAERAQKVSLMTLHAAKGLEFKVVFVSGCEHDLLPLAAPHNQTASDPDEERRLLFVGMTRAMQRLYLCHARHRKQYGHLEVKQRSPFIDAIDEDLYVIEQDPDSRPKPKKSTQRQLDLFEST